MVWTCKVITNQHPVYKIQYKSCKGNVEKWITRDKLRRCEKSTTHEELVYPDKATETEQPESELLRATIFEDMNPPELNDRGHEINIERDASQNSEIQRELNEEDDNLNLAEHSYNLRGNVRVPERLGHYYCHPCLYVYF